MSYDPDIHHRRSIRIPEYDYASAGAYFVTICTVRRACLLGEIVDGTMAYCIEGHIAAATWLWLGEHFDGVSLDAWCVMPNHLHGIVLLPESSEQAKPLGRIIGAFKTVSNRMRNQMFHTSGETIWQRNFYERIIRTDRELQNVREYIARNPAQWAEDEYHPASVG